MIQYRKEETMLLQPYLNFDGQCRATFTFYQQLLGGKIETMETHVGRPAQDSTPPA